ncbi:type II secretion system F family protein [Kitasatospora sp. MAP12-44]|uniref:type II secretion system F family protein n=1 Tax=Kitasatospora sp. MAP12-44 TaxID=3035099 RepID=UPI0024735101|nr:type II secretion system F family protein [Kitasatospora sp. MAP12-44]
MPLSMVALWAWAVLNRRVLARRRSRRVLVASGAVVGDMEADGGSRTLRWLLDPPKIGRPRWLVAELQLVPVGLLLGQLLSSPVPPLAAAVLVVPLHRQRARWRTAHEAQGRALAITELCTALAGELRCGATPEQALDAVASRSRSAGGMLDRLGPEAVVRLAAGRYGADVPAAFRWLAELPGGSGAAALGACWQVTADSGSSLATGLDQLTEGLRAERALAEEIRSELAGPRTTAALLAALPVLGLVLGSALGAQPLWVLLHTPVGLGCLGAGVLLEVAGLLWTEWIVQQARHLAGIGAHGMPVRDADRTAADRGSRQPSVRRPYRAGAPRREVSR